ncbi:hypothetical protein LOAG_13719 [Loa loa]|uniref:Uncharacterized protein n=2 Tax=Loa loa TaxID=7209 RepID=A0A1S0TJ09_LOALO|nr:hypothetical protein LOAG_13719 [Loa loa]EFO14796.1 hypothetical protein LOAG_13719 [Loa loa]
MDNDTVKYLKEKMRIEEGSEVKPPEKMGSLIDRTKMQRARSNGTRSTNWKGSISFLSSEGENKSQQNATKERGKSITGKRSEMKKQSKNFKNGVEANICPKTVAATVAGDSIRETCIMCKEVRLINPGEPRKTAELLVFFDTGSDCNYVLEPMVAKLNLKQTSPSVRMLLTGTVGTKKYGSRKMAFGVQTLSGNVKNIQTYIVDSILERMLM